MMKAEKGSKALRSDKRPSRAATIAQKARFWTGVSFFVKTLMTVFYQAMRFEIDWLVKFSTTFLFGEASLFIKSLLEARICGHGY